MNIFGEPVDTDEVTDYLDLIKKPMDFSTMRAKVTQDRISGKLTLSIPIPKIGWGWMAAGGKMRILILKNSVIEV